jgi:hypothetical protein
MSKTQANRLVEAAAVEACLRTAPIGATPQTESQCRELARLKTEEGCLDLDRIAAVWDRIASTAGYAPVTAKAVRYAVNAELGVETRPKSDRQERLRRELLALSRTTRVGGVRAAAAGAGEGRPVVHRRLAVVRREPELERHRDGGDQRRGRKTDG